MTDTRGLWQAVLGELEVTVSRANFSTWFRHTSIVSNQDGHVVIGVPNVFTKSWLEKKYHGDIKAALQKVSTDVQTIEYKIGSAPTSAAPSRPARDHKPTKVVQTSLPTASTAKPHNLNEKYTFDTFVVGSSNELAYAACQAVAKSPGTKYNPLFIYGGVGLGKTHLMQAVGNEISRQDPSKRIEYVTSESFTNEFLQALQKKNTNSFAEKFRQVDVLIVDDVQFLATKERTVEEFFHTFNALHQTNKQIILSSDKPPQSINGLEDRLRSRFASGMTADIQPPDLETRAAILQRKAAAHGLALELDVIDYLARHCQSNIRELEGTLTQLMAYCELRNLQPSVAAATALLGNATATRTRFRTITPKVVIERTAAYFDLSTADIIGARRDKEIVVPRQIAMYLMRQDLSMSFPKIGGSVGGRDHTTAMHSVRKIEQDVERDEMLRNDVQAIRERLQVS
jgi:chromosomal replication initiator protein